MTIKLLIVEGYLQEENQNINNAGIQTLTVRLRDSLAYITKVIDLVVENHSDDHKIFEFIGNIGKYDVTVWVGSSLDI